MYHPTTRVLTILELLQARGGLSGAELATRLEVDRRTVRRYITMLQDLGIPIEAARGPDGGYRLRPGFKLPPLMLTDEEALAVTLSLIGARRLGVAADPHTIESALAKIERVLPDGLRKRLQAVESSIAFLPAPAAPQPSGEIVLMISAAVQQQRSVQIRYRSWREESARDIDPYGLVLHWDRWYVVGWCHLRQAVRIFRLDRMVSAVVGESRFERPPAFDSLQYLLDSFATAPWGYPIEALLETTMEDARRRFQPGSAVFEQEADGVVVRTNVENLEWAARALLMLGCPFVIRQPKELRAALLAVAAEAVAIADRED